MENATLDWGRLPSKNIPTTLARRISNENKSCSYTLSDEIWKFLSENRRENNSEKK